MRLWPANGTIHIYEPFLYGTLFAAAVSDPPPTPSSLLKTAGILLLSTVLYGGAACAFNDLVDLDLDRRVVRTRHRPLARKAITPSNGCLFVLAQDAIWLATIAQLSQRWMYYTIPLFGLVTLYPYSKRFTDFTPVVLGITVAWGVFIGCASMGVDPLDLVLQNGDGGKTAGALCSLYFSCMLWTTIFETIYAHQDIEDDKKQGVKSLAIRLEGRTKQVLSVLAALQVALYAYIGWVIDAGTLYYAGTCVGMGASLAVMIWKADLKQPSDCLWWFFNGTWFVGGSIVAGFLTQIWGDQIWENAFTKRLAM